MPTRRRFISIVAACAGIAPVAGSWAAVRETPAVVWKGQAMGALASMTLVHPDRAKAQAQLERCVEELERLEAIFSLYRPASALSRLNAARELAHPPHELIELLGFALSLARQSEGAFDPTVQPLYRLYADHYARPGAAARGPSERAIEATLSRVGFGAVELRAELIRLRRPGMALTLNGVAQGFITDRVAELLRSAGFHNVLVDLGEARALGHHAGGRPWRAALADPHQPGGTLLDLPLGESAGALPALATSAGAGTLFGTDPRIHHLLDPRTGRSANHHASVSVGAARATLADGLSTTLSILPIDRAAPLLASYAGTRAWLVDANGNVRLRGVA